MWFNLWSWPAWWWASYAAGLATASARIMSGQRPSPLLTMHVERLKPRENAGKRLPYVMRALRVVRVSSN